VTSKLLKMTQASAEQGIYRLKPILHRYMDVAY